MITHSGVMVSRDEGVPSLEDVALALCRTPMFAGATHRFFSVAHHSLAVAELMEKNKIYGLLHEAEVVAVGDCPGPEKVSEQRVGERAIRNRFIASLHLPPLTDAIWEELEIVDQVTLGAIARLCGLPQVEHFWPDSPAVVAALPLIERLLELYPPHLQLDYNSSLMKEFIRRTNELRALV